jgi:acetyl esterase/lipase
MKMDAKHMSKAGIAAAVVASFLAVVLVSCASANPGNATDVARETIRVKLPAGSANVDIYWPAMEAPAPMVIVAHGFSRNRGNMAGWGQHLATAGFVSVVPDLPTWSDHARNGRFISELRAYLLDDELRKQRIDPARVGLVGFSAGGLSSLLSAARSPGVAIWVGLDPVDRDGLGVRAAAMIHSRAVVITAEPSACNANGNAREILAALPGHQHFRVNGAVHVDAEWPTSWLAERVCGRSTEERRAEFQLRATQALEAAFALPPMAGAGDANQATGLAPGLVAAAPRSPPEIEFTRSSLATADFGDARLRGTEYGLEIRGASLPVGEGEFRWALDYAYQRYEYSGLPSRNRDLHRLELPLSWQVDAPRFWLAELRPVVASSSNVFKELWSRGSSDDFMWHGRALLGRSPVGRGWGWQLGGTWDDAFGRERVYPVAALLRQHEGVSMELGWPVSRAMRDAGRGIEAGGEIVPAGARWHVVSDERDGASFDYEVRAWRAGGILRWRSTGGLVLTTRLGLEFDRRHRLEDDTGASVNRAVDEAAFFALAAAYRW